MNKSFIYFLFILQISVSSCMDKQELYKGTTDVTLENYFDYSTTDNVKVNISYGAECPKAYFEVYSENPFAYQQETGQVVKRTDIIHIASGFTDDSGNYSREVVLLSSVKEVYIYSPDFGVPVLYKTTIDNKQINANISFDNEIDLTSLGDEAARSSVSRATVDRIKGYVPNTLGSWDSKGVPDYLDPSLKIDIDGQLKKYITSNFKENDDNSGSPYICEEADILVKEKSHVWINYFGGQTSARSVFAYYCYDENATIDDIKAAAKNACTIFPYTHGNALGSYSGVGTYLRYIDKDGKLHVADEGFPAGTKIGVFIWNNGFNLSEFTKNTFYSTTALNSSNKSYAAAFAAKSALGRTYNIITMEDYPTGNLDYNDVAFIISSNPIRAIEFPEIAEPGDNRTETQVYRGVIAFEDNWPAQGDYDMNDVVMKYQSTITFNTSNNIEGIEDKFTLVWTGAAKSNGFSYQVPFSLDLVNIIGHKSISDGNVINVFDNARQELGVSGLSPADMPSHSDEIKEKTFTISMTFKEPYQYAAVPPYNPFIRTSKQEIHLPNHPTTVNADNTFPNGADISDGKTTFFICKDGYPFAFHLDARSDESIMNLDLRQESVRIDVAFPKFKEWMLTRDPSLKWW